MTGDAELTKKYHQDFKREYIAQFDQDGFVLLQIQVEAWLENVRKSEEGL